MVLRLRKSKKYYIKKFGCYANEVDSDYIAGLLENLGFSELEKRGRNETEEIGYALKMLIFCNQLLFRQTEREDKVYGIGKMIKIILKESGANRVYGRQYYRREKDFQKAIKNENKNFDGYFPPPIRPV